MIEDGFITNNFVRNFGRLNGICSEKNVQWGIVKNPNEMKYNGLVGKHTIEAEYCDDLFEKMIEAARSY